MLYFITLSSFIVLLSLHLEIFRSMCVAIVCFPNSDVINFDIKVGLSPSKKILFVCFNENPLKIMKNALYFILKAIFVLNIFRFLS